MKNDDKYIKSQTKCTPQDDIDCYYNNRWKELQKVEKKQKKQKKMSYVDNFVILQEEIDAELLQIINEQKLCGDYVTNNIVLLRDSYANRGNNIGTITKMISSVQAIKNVSDLANTIKIFSQLGIDTLFSFSVIPNTGDPWVYVLCISEAPLTFASQSSYSDTSTKTQERFTTTLISIYNYICDAIVKIDSDIVSFCRDIMIFEILASKTMLDMEQTNDPLFTNNVDSFENFKIKFDSGTFWHIILRHLSAGTPIIYENAAQLLFLKRLITSASVNSNILRMIKNYLLYSIIKKYGQYLSIADDLADIMDIYEEPDATMINLFYSKFGYHMQYIYDSKYTNPLKNQKICEMFLKMKAYCIKYFHSNDANSFNESTKREAIKKLCNLNIIIGSQTYTVDLYQMPTLGNDFFHNIIEIDKFYYKTSTSWIGKGVNPEWISINNDIFSFEINAYYDPTVNAIYMPTSITNDVFYDLRLPLICNYGGLGSIIAHEIMHCFDNAGALYDYKGFIRNWWTEHDYTAYNKEIQKVRGHYSKIKINDVNINFNVSVGEDISDIAGLKLSIRTYIDNYMGGKKISEMSNDEKELLKGFFARWAYTLRNVEDTASLLSSMNSDVHSPSVIRLNAPFSHIDEYYEIYNVQPHNFNYIEPASRTKFLDIN